MNERYFSIVEAGMAGELRELSLAEALVHLKNHLRNFHLDPDVCALYADRILKDPGFSSDPEAVRLASHLVDKAVQLRPFSPDVIGSAARLTGDPRLARRREILRLAGSDEETYRLIEGLDPLAATDREGGDALSFLAELLSLHPGHLPAAQHALQLEHLAGRAPGEWLARFDCPEEVRPDWDIALFDHYASLGLFEQAFALLPGLDHGRMRETSLCLAAECFAAAGDQEEAARLYGEALRRDPLLGPAAHRLAEILSPASVDASLPGEIETAVCLYTFNKAAMLAETLQSLRASDIGRAGLHILVNGCSDDSLAVAEKARELFPENAVEVVALPVNIGAPAARNWLLALPDVRRKPYVAFMDDDVFVPKDWLARFLTTAEADKRVAVTGCKVVYPGRPAMLQYLYRYVGLAGRGLLRMSLHAPHRRFDNGFYDFTRETRSVMGCLHLLRTEALRDAPLFDIRFSPSQVDDIDHDLQLCLAGHKIMYCGRVSCVHRQSSGLAENAAWSADRTGNALGNDIKLYYKHRARLDDLAKLDSLSPAPADPAGAE